MKTSRMESNNSQDRRGRVWSLLSLAALGVLLNAGPATGKIRMDLPPILLSEADEMTVEGPRKRFRFGPYQVSGFHRGSIGSASAIEDEWSADRVFDRATSEREDRYGFIVSESNGAFWEVECVITVEIDPMGANRGTFACAFRQPGEETAEKLAVNLLSRNDGRLTGTVTAGDTEIRIRGVRRTARGSAFFPLFLGYHFFIDHRAVGAVQTVGKGPVWLHPSATGRIRSALAVASAALFLQSRVVSLLRSR